MRALCATTGRVVLTVAFPYAIVACVGVKRVAFRVSVSPVV